MIHLKLFEEHNTNITIKEIEWKKLEQFVSNYKIVPKLNDDNNVLHNFIDYSFLEKYKILLAINNDTIVGYFYKFLGGNENQYDDGYVQSGMKGIGSVLLKEMSKYGNYTTFCNLTNIGSLKMHFKANPSKIICITDGSPEKNNYGSSNYNNQISTEYQTTLSELYYSNGTDECEIMIDGKINTKVVNFVLNNNKISVSNQEIASNLKYYLLY
jgi:hypothetical protein